MLPSGSPRPPAREVVALYRVQPGGPVRPCIVELVADGGVRRRPPTRKTPALRKAVVNIHQPELLPLSLDEMVDKDDPCRLVIKLVSLLDLSPLRERLPLVGAPAYPLEIMLALEMFSKWDGEYASRQVEKRCKHDVRYKLVCQGHTPDHTTIWRFRRSLAADLDWLLAETVSLGRKAGLASLGRASIDGTKLPAAASQWRKFREASEEADKELTHEFEGSTNESDLPAVEPTEAASSAAVAASTPEDAPFAADADEPGAGAEPSSSDCPELSAQETASEIIANSKKVKTKRVALPCTDPDARTIRARQGHFIVGYNPQVIVDRDTDLIMAVHMSKQSSDSNLLEPALEKYLELHGELPSDLLADAGFDTPNNAHVLAELGIDACVSCKERSLFWRLDEQDRPICPMGHPATNYSTFKKKGVQVLRLIVKECPTCPMRSVCLPKQSSGNKAITFDAKANPAHWIRQKHRAKSEEGKERLKQRGQTIEFGFARMKERLKFRRISMWGIQGTRTEVGIMAVAMNLAIIGAKVGIAGLEALLTALLLLFHALVRPQNRHHRPYTAPRSRFDKIYMPCTRLNIASPRAV